MAQRLNHSFFQQDVLHVAPSLLGKTLVRKLETGEEIRLQITETEAYRGSEDLACHASKGKTPRTSIMFDTGGFVYVYLIYGMYWMLNFVTGTVDIPQAVLIRGVAGANGPGRLTKKLNIDKTFYGEDLTASDRIWVENAMEIKNFNTGPRIGIDYAGDKWKNMPWRFWV